MPRAAQKKHKVVVYAKTDRWYIHPYANAGEGKSWASIESNGSWKIEIVSRSPAASSVAVLVVKSDTNAPPDITNYRDIPSVAVTERKLEGTPDFGKF